ncbi:hypothetical protein A3A93_06455 [Candidatus Roizmanbacteria bacterium RIFCSPLOWO2_01_FULL_38_12]|uniref:ABC transporter domain-containing protein n=1 Tax=Candidatus Roizmanbacteria bacterium RIFCSPLOWO2_01_FULL_38_12 TaxID=1802061 RepID=A0A1F7IU30_9BACT|nr:MAG: hypothetical protein A3A93_06455 [Candidatus Roizmanbacteria bacterium RIFCSPLOWO2_01_FULL_38_12]
MQNNGVVISFENVDKYFYFQHQKTLKELVQAFFVQRKTLEKVHALKNISFNIKKGESIGVIGRNGAGKSTLLKIIAGVSTQTTGKVTVNGRVVPLLELGAGFHPELTARENVFLNGVILGLKEKYIENTLNEIIDFAEISEFVDVPVKYFSSGMYMRLAFSVAIFVDPEILLVDEILSVGDSAFRVKCLKKMLEFKKKGVTIIFVSHDLKTVESFCERAIYLKSGSVQYDGDIKTALKQYQDVLEVS